MLRLAGQALKNSGKFIISNMGNNAGEVALRVVPDLGFGVLAATQTPGDIGDKLIAGGSQALGGVLGGVGTVGALRKVPRLADKTALLNLADMAGSIGGDFAGMAVGDNVMRGKDKLMGGAGETPWERMSAEQQAQYAQQLEQQILSQYGLLPGTREQFAQANPNLMVSYVDPSSGMGVA